MSKLIRVENLFFAYDDTFILESASFEINAGEFACLFGPNGGGKTTLLRLILGFLKPTKGTISIERRACRLGYVPQVARFDKLFPISTLEVVLMGGLSQLTFWGRYPKEVKERAEEALEQVGLSSFRKAAFGTLSGGQAQRALIARALIKDPTLLLLDEPTASVDYEAEKAIHELLSKLKGKVTILMVTHQLQSVMRHADRFLCVQKTVTPLSAEKLCEHFALGLYHPPLKGAT